MKLSDTDIEVLNKQLADYGGIDTAGGEAMWRVAWAEDQYEYRLTEYTDSGLLLLNPEVRYLPKYQWLKGKYVLEHLVGIPQVSAPELPASKKSYEIIHAFEDRNGNPLPPIFRACKLVIDTVHAAMHGTGNLRKYVEPTAEEEMIKRRKDIDEIENELFGEQSSLQGTTKTGETIIVPRNYGDN